MCGFTDKCVWCRRPQVNFYGLPVGKFSHVFSPTCITGGKYRNILNSSSLQDGKLEGLGMGVPVITLFSYSPGDMTPRQLYSPQKVKLSQQFSN